MASVLQTEPGRGDQEHESSGAVTLTPPGPQLEEALEALCKLVEEQSLGVTASVRLTDRGTGRLTTIAGIEPANAQPAASWAAPFFSTGEVLLGEVVFHSRRARPPGKRDRRLLERAALLAQSVVEQHLAAQRMRTNERRWRAIFDNAVIGIATVDPSGHFVDVNHAYEQLVGYTEQELRNMTFLELTHEDDRERNCSGANVTTLDQPQARIEKRYVRKDGTVIWVRVNASFIPGHDGAPSFRVGLVEDITDRKHAEDELRRSAAHLAEGQRISQTGSWVLDLSSGSLYWSQEMYRICAFDPERGEPNPREYIERMHPDDAVRVAQYVAQAIRDRTPFEGDYRLVFPDGSVRHIHHLGHPVVVQREGEREEHVEFVGSIMDVTDRKRTEEQLNSSLNQVRALATRLMRAQDDERRRIARELHETTAQDLAALKMNLGALDRRASILDEHDRELLAESATLAERCMTDVRTLSYLLHPPFLDEVGLTSALRWYAMGFAERSGIKVKCELPEEFERLRQEIETTLFRIVQESLINIHRHAHSPTASIRLRTAANQLILEVQDKGRGIPQNGRARHGGGLGVGIAGMRERMEQLDGQLEIESSSRGTTVRALLPLSRERP